MELGIVGAGRMGCAAACSAARAGYEVALSSRRGAGRLAELASRLGTGVRAVPIADALALPLVLLAVPWRSVEAVLGAHPTRSGAVLMDATNSWDERPAVAAMVGTSEAVADWTAADVVRVFSTVHARRLAAPDGQAVPYACDAPAAGSVAARFVRAIGFVPVHAGTLRQTAASMAPGGSLFGVTTDARSLAGMISFSG